MKKILWLLALPLSLSVLSGCKAGCTAEQVIGEKLAPAVAQKLHCVAVAQIQADIIAGLAKVPAVCSAVGAKPEGPIANVACPLASEGVVALVGSKVPASWGCDPSAGDLGSTLTSLCELLPF